MLSAELGLLLVEVTTSTAGHMISAPSLLGRSPTTYRTGFLAKDIVFLAKDCKALTRLVHLFRETNGTPFFTKISFVSKASISRKKQTVAARR